MTSGVMVVFVVVIMLLVILVDYFMVNIPFSVEKNISMTSIANERREGPLPGYLQSMADHIASVEELPEDITVTIHYVDEEIVNAFATLGGNVIVFRGLLEKLPGENALAMLLAHEIAHIKHRHPVKSLGRGVVVALALSIISTSIGDALLDQFMGNAGMLTMLKYSREMESQADETALRTMLTMYGNVQGATDLFEVLQQETERAEPPEFLSTHPVTETRISDLDSYMARSHSENSRILPLPAEFPEWLITDTERTR